MAFTGTTFSEIDAARDEIKKIIAGNKARIERARFEFGLVATAMATAGTEFGPIVPAAAALLATEPTNPAFVNLNQAILKHLDDFNAVSADATAKDQLLNGV